MENMNLCVNVLIRIYKIKIPMFQSKNILKVITYAYFYP